jgi:long-chain acyl-CoA synthetase
MSYRTLVELYREAFRTHPRPDAFRSKVGETWQNVSSDEAGRLFETVAAALVARGIAPGERVAILSENRFEWAAADFGILTAGAVTVPVYATLTAAQVRHILFDSEAKLAIVSTALQRDKLVSLLPELPGLRSYVMLDPPAEGAAAPADPRASAWGALLEEGARALAADPDVARRRGDAVKEDDLATLIYTSGTTGPPKGVMLTHANLASNVRDALLDFDIGPHDRALSILPLSHVFERMGGQFTMVARAVSIAYAESVERAGANMIETSPTIVMSVPRLFEKIDARVQDTARAGGALRWAIFKRAREAARRMARARAPGRSPGLGLALSFALYDRLVYRTLRARVGGKLRFFVSGGAPLAAEISEFFTGAGLPILEGYGLTETSPVIAVNRPKRNKPGTVGPPIANMTVKIAGDGEILVQGPGVMKGYLNLPGETAAALQDGWFHTGDIGHLDTDGHLVITDRKKDLLVTAGGKNIAPQPIENAIKLIPYVTEAVLIGDKRPYCTALLVPEWRALEGWAKAHGVAFASRAELLARPEVQAMYETKIAEATKELARFERVKKFRLLDAEFSIESGELTPTLKVRRKIVNQKYAEEIEAMYGEPGGGDAEPAEARA